MNKKLITLVSVGAIAAMFLVGVIESAFGRLMPYGQLHNVAFNAIDLVATLLALPVRLYAFFVYHDHGSWPLPALVLLLAMSGLMWGVIVERTVWILSRRKAAQ